MQGRTKVYDEAYFSYVEEVNLRRTQQIGKITTYKWKLLEALDFLMQVAPPYPNGLGGPGDIIFILD